LPKCDDSWWKLKNNARSGVAYQPEHSILAGVMDAIKPVFGDLASVDLLKSCLHEQTPNPIESLKSVIWTKVHKTDFVRLDTVKFGIHDIVLCFNDGVEKIIMF
jgi:hypothetical protein